MKRFALLALLSLLACRTAPRRELAPRDVAELSAARGAVSQTLLPDPDAPTVELGRDEEYVAPTLLRTNRAPDYPAALVPLRLAPATIVMRVTFDEEGNAITAVRSPLARSAGGEHQETFEAAAREALLSWRCRPAQIRKFRPGPDSDGDGKTDYLIIDGERLLKAFFDVAFDFAVVNGVPVVKTR